MNNLSTSKAEQEDRGHRVLYVLVISLVLAVVGMSLVASYGQSFQ
jgi:hypothetical protein